MTIAGRVAKIFLLAALLVGSDADRTHAGTGRIVTLPTAGVVPVSGLNIELSWKWCDVTGLRPIRVVVTPSTKPAFARDREITIAVSPYRYNLGNIETTVSQTIALPVGERQVETFMYIPERHEQLSAKIEVFEGGRSWRDLSNEHVQVDSRNNRRQDGFPAILVIDYDMPFWHQRSNSSRRVATPPGKKTDKGSGDQRLPDMSLVVKMFPDNSRITRAGSVLRGRRRSSPLREKDDVLRELPNWDFIEMVHPMDLPPEWIGLSGLDLVFVTLTDLQEMRVDYPDQFRAVTFWLLSGGNLIVLGAGPEFQRLVEIDQSLDLAPIDEEDNMRGWRPRPKLSKRIHHLHDDAEPIGEDSQRREETKASTGLANFVHRDAGLGQVVAFSKENVFPGNRLEWATLFNTVDDWLWYRRHGLSLNRDNRGFWRFIIAGVGLAPVNLFRVLITLFVILIGPVNYLLLRRAGRLSWLLATVPMGALLVTASLVVYAVATDGLGVRSRIRSMTHIDQRQGHAATWSRQVYYAGLAPSAGLRYPRDAAVFPLLQAPNYEFKSGQRRIDWREGQQILARGYLQSRVMTQFMVIRSAASPLRLDVELTDSDGVRVQNRLGATIRQLYVCDEQSLLHGGFNIDAGATATLKPQSPQAARARMIELIREYPLEPPPGFDEDSYVDVFAMNRGFSRYYGRGRVPDPSTATSILEQRLLKIQRPEALGPRSYVAVVESCNEVPLGIADLNPQQSLYVVTGAW